MLTSSREEVAQVLRLAAEHRVSTERMAALKEIDAEDLLAVVELGVILGELQTRVEAEGLFYPPDPASLARCSLGGNVAENAGGPRASRPLEQAAGVIARQKRLKRQWDPENLLNPGKIFP